MYTVMLTLITDPSTKAIKPQLTPAQAVQRLLALPTWAAQQHFLRTYSASFDATALGLLKAQADRLLRTQTAAALRIGVLVCALGAIQRAPSVTALGLVIEANGYSVGGQGEYTRAVAAYTEAVALYMAQGQVVAAGRALVGKLFALASLGRYAEALATGDRAAQLFTDHNAQAEMAGLGWNLAILHGQQGNDRAALHHFDQVRAYYQGLDVAVDLLPLVEQNRAVVLRNLGEFDASIAASQQAEGAFLAQGQLIEAARAQQNLAHTYLILGRYHDALTLLEAAAHTFATHDRQADLMVVELHVTSCLLHLRQFNAVLSKCQALQQHFIATGQQAELGQALLNGAMAYAGLHQFERALACLAEVRTIFTPESTPVWHAMAELERAAILFHRTLQSPTNAAQTPAWSTALAATLAISESVIPIFAQQGLVVHEARAALLSARIAHQLGDCLHTQQRLAQALAIGEKNDLATLVYQVYALAGALCRQRADINGASVAYGQAIGALERLCSQTMGEFRASFLEDKTLLYEEMVDLCLALHHVDQGFAYAERAKSRALLALVATPAQPAQDVDNAITQALQTQLAQLREEWNRLHQQLTMTTAALQPTRSVQLFDEATAAHTRHGGTLSSPKQQLFALEAQITDLWRQLQIRRRAVIPLPVAPFATSADPTPTYDRQRLPAASVLVEYFALHGRFVAFVVTAQGVQAIRLLVTERQVTQTLRLLELNWRAVLGAEPGNIERLLQNAQGLLQQLYAALWAPVAAAVGDTQQLWIVPHGVLHHLPFHALHDGDHYLLQRYAISYLPSAELLAHYKPAAHTDGAAVVVGHSYGGRLPHALEEAHAVASQVGGRLLLEQAATQAALQSLLGQSTLIHLATHGHFRADNHLFSGLALADGWLTTLDISNLRLRASLVTLSACQTGRHIIGGGDELLGLIRAFLGAGASSLVATLWAVEDGATAQLMAHFYRQLTAGLGKGAALRQAQLSLLAGPDRYRHPYYWAPFFLVGDSGPL